MRAASGSWRSRTLSKSNNNKKKKSQLIENLNDADIISMPTSATCTVKLERIILFMRNRESVFVFRRRVAKFFENRPYHGFRRHLDGKAKRSEITVFVWESDGK